MSTGGSVSNVKVFLSYAHVDEELQKEFNKHLGALKRERVIEVWSDHQIAPGSDWNREILRELEAADLIVLLVSADFLDSDFCYEEEMRRAVARHEAGTARVVPIALRTCHWGPAPFAKLQGLPRGLKAVAELPASERDAVLAGLAKGIQEAAEEVAARKASAVPTAPVSPLNGWELISPVLLAGLPPLREEEVLRYFDGAVPTWRHAVSDAIPRRDIVSKLTMRLDGLRTSKDGCSLQLIRAAGGEGKSTLLLQVAADAALSGDWTVLWRPSPEVGLPLEHVAELGPEKQWLIVADDAENLVSDLSGWVQRLHQAGSEHVHFLLAARDTDWHGARGDQQGWSARIKVEPGVILRGISSSDARAIVGAWATHGPTGLKALSALPDPDDQVEAFVNAVKDASKSEGSLFGGLLAVRFGEDGLHAHVREFLGRLRAMRIQDSGHSLFDALLSVAACHAVAMPGLNENVLADLMSVPPAWVYTRVVIPLGEEAAAVRSGHHVFTRHSKVAAAVLVEAEAAFGADVAEIWRVVVAQTIRTSREIRIGQSHSPILHAGPRLLKALPEHLSEHRRKKIAIAAAEAAVEHQPDRLDAIVDLGKTCRLAEEFEQAVEVFRERLREADSKADCLEFIRGFWYEWGVCEGRVETRATDAWLQGLSLSDHLNPAPITDQQAKISCAGLGVAFGKLAEPRPDCPSARGRRVAAYLGRLTNPDRRTAGFFARHDRDADRIGTPHPSDVEEAIDWLTTAVAQAGQELKDPFLQNLLKPEDVSFELLRSFFNNRSPTPSGSRVPTHAHSRS